MVAGVHPVSKCREPRTGTADPDERSSKPSFRFRVRAFQTSAQLVIFRTQTRLVYLSRTSGDFS